MPQQRYAIYTNKPRKVEAVQVTLDNFVEVANWCDGTIILSEEKKGSFKLPLSKDDYEGAHIFIRVFRAQNDRMKQAHVGDWVLKQGKSFKVYLDRAFRDNFELGPDPDEDLGTLIYQSILSELQAANGSNEEIASQVTKIVVPGFSGTRMEIPVTIDQTTPQTLPNGVTPTPNDAPLMTDMTEPLFKEA